MLHFMYSCTSNGGRRVPVPRWSLLAEKWGIMSIGVPVRYMGVRPVLNRHLMRREGSVSPTTKQVFWRRTRILVDTQQLCGLGFYIGPGSFERGILCERAPAGGNSIKNSPRDRELSTMRAQWRGYPRALQLQRSGARKPRQTPPPPGPKHLATSQWRTGPSYHVRLIKRIDATMVESVELRVLWGEVVPETPGWGKGAVAAELKRLWTRRGRVVGIPRHRDLGDGC